MGTFIVSFIGNGFVQSAQHAPILDRLSPTARRHSMVRALALQVDASVALTCTQQPTCYDTCTCLAKDINNGFAVFCKQVLLYFTIIVSVVSLFGVLTAPDIIREGSDFVTRLKSDNVWVVVLEKMRHGLGDGVIMC